MHDVKSSILCSIDILFTFINNELYRMILDIQTFVYDTIKGKKKTKKEKYISRRIYILSTCDLAHKASSDHY